MGYIKIIKIFLARKTFLIYNIKMMETENGFHPIRDLPKDGWGGLT